MIPRECPRLLKIHFPEALLAIQSADWGVEGGEPGVGKTGREGLRDGVLSAPIYSAAKGYLDNILTP